MEINLNTVSTPQDLLSHSKGNMTFERAYQLKINPNQDIHLHLVSFKNIFQFAIKVIFFFLKEKNSY